jgi:hypothetical protein
MIEVSWEIGSSQFDGAFDEASSNAWDVWSKDKNFLDTDGKMNVAEWEKQFHCKPIVNPDHDTWTGLIFKDKASYVLFLLEWS